MSNMVTWNNFEQGTKMGGKKKVCIKKPIEHLGDADLYLKIHGDCNLRLYTGYIYHHESAKINSPDYRE